MSKHYLLDIFANDPLHGAIKEVVVPVPGAPTTINGRYVVRVPDDIVIPDSVTNPNDLITQKYASMLANSGLFTSIVYDGMLDAAGIDVANSFGISTGVRGACSLYPAGGITYPQSTMQMSMVAVGGVPVTQAMLRAELFKFVPIDNVTDRYLRGYSEVAVTGADVDCYLSFNNGATWVSAIDSTLVNVALADQGTQLIVKFVRTSWSATNPRLYLGSWAVLY
jgi:hypothetical protein